MRELTPNLIENNYCQKYYYEGPIYKFNRVCADVQLETFAKSYAEAKRNFIYQAKRELGLDIVNSKIEIDEELICGEDELVDDDYIVQDKNIKQNVSDRLRKKCDKCGTYLNDAGECPVCDLGDEDMLEIESFLRHNENDIYEYVDDEMKQLREDTRAQLINKSKSADTYKQNVRGKNRFERKKYSKIATQVKNYNNINMDELFKSDLLTINIPVSGETSNYDVTLKIDGVVAEIAKNIKYNNNKLEYRTIVQSLTKIFNLNQVKVKCTCNDFKYRYAHALIVSGDSVDGTDKDPGPGKTGMANSSGKGCKHILLVLNNLDWAMKVASVINNYINYLAENKRNLFLKYVFPKLYGVSADDAADENIVPENTKLDTDKNIIDIVNQWGRDRGKIKKGTNKNPVSAASKK